MRKKHNKCAEQENKNIKTKNTLKNTTVRMLMKKEKISSSFEKTSLEEICLMCGGRLFQARGAAMANTRSPSVE